MLESGWKIFQLVYWRYNFVPTRPVYIDLFFHLNSHRAVSPLTEKLGSLFLALPISNLYNADEGTFP